MPVPTGAMNHAPTVGAIAASGVGGFRGIAVQWARHPLVITVTVVILLSHNRIINNVGARFIVPATAEGRF